MCLHANSYHTIDSKCPIKLWLYSSSFELCSGPLFSYIRRPILLPLQHLLKSSTALQSLRGCTIIVATTVSIAYTAIICISVWRALLQSIALPLVRRAGRFHKTSQPAFLQSSVHFFRNVDAFYYVAIAGLGGLCAWCRTLIHGRRDGLIG
jgi:hypothetical protein